MSGNRSRSIVNEISLHAVDDLLTDLFRCQHGILITLDVAVVGNGNSRMPPLVCLLDGNRGRDQCVHGGHLCMQMKLNALYRGIILTRQLFDLGKLCRVEQAIRSFGAIAILGFLGFVFCVSL